MGKIVTMGRCEKKFTAEKMTLTVAFQKEGDDAAYLVANVQEQCEKFLGELARIGIPPETVILEDRGVSGTGYDPSTARARRELILETRIDARLCAYIFSLIKKSEKNIEYQITYGLEDEEEKTRELIRAAVEDARRQADLIAEALGRRVTGVESVNEEQYGHRLLAKSAALCDGLSPEIPEAFRSDTPLSDRALLPTVVRAEDVVIAWRID